ncbi:MAG: hypothetical protein OEO20_07515 [Gemmatimonadota bacterium]|nr:hypothetical protein [Gemmatimonadota bacterium]MDH3368647.1 hypothetical protein [Gemmatimonadota bacterium]MDH3478137.1 hypothetical protein [Gemmatimonadota bacterium]MDH5550118.1 hypothetical protein [Gemmatimonadota bacterium]
MAHYAPMPDVLTGLEEGLRSRYAIERQLGEGGMAVVYLAKDERHDRHVALKVLQAAALPRDRRRAVPARDQNRCGLDPPPHPAALRLG